MENALHATNAVPPVFPNWFPDTLNTYLLHIACGVSIREIARQHGCHASTVLRQIRRHEQRRDDPLVDEALDMIAQNLPRNPEKEHKSMTTVTTFPQIPDVKIEREARRILRRLCESGAYLLVSPKMEVAAVFKETVQGRPTRIAVVDRPYVHVFVLKEWISGEQVGKIGRYNITAIGRSALKRMISQDQAARNEKPDNAFGDQHKVFGERSVGTNKSIRYNLAESPLALLARKKNRDGAMFLTSEMLEAGERLREDFERAQLGPNVAQNWDRFLTAGATSGWNGESGGASGARERVADAMKALGPGLGDVAFRVCCFLEGLEKAEKRLGWSARSGKVVLKIALQRLADHYGITAPEQRRAS